MHVNHMLLIGAVAVGGYMLGPQLRLPSWLPQGHIFGMRLDPSLTSEIEDRRGQRGDGEIDGGDMGDGPPPWAPRGGQGGPGPWVQGGGPDGGFDGPRGRGVRMGCWDTVQHRDVDMSFCDREHGRRR